MLRLATCYTRRFAWLVAGATLLVPGRASAGHPPTPPPCVLDGVCLPKWETWGYYRTNWRPFPGDRVAAAPTPVELPESAEDQRGLGGFEEPMPQDEIRSGPNRPDVDEEEPTPGLEGSGIEGLENFDGGEGLNPLPEEGPAADPLGIRLPQSNGVLVQPAAARVQMPPARPVPLPPAAAAPARLRVMPQPTSLPPVPAAPSQPANANAKNLGGDDPPPSLPTRLRRLALLKHSSQQAVAAARRDGQVQGAAYEDPAPRPPASLLQRFMGR